MDGRETTICRVRSVPDKDLEDDFEEKGGANACRQKFQSLSEFYCCLIFEVNYINFTSPSKCIVIVKYMQSIFFFHPLKTAIRLIHYFGIMHIHLYRRRIIICLRFVCM